MKHWLNSIWKGALIGCSNIIPGVSGGTVAVSLGVFDPMIRSINGLSRRDERKASLLCIAPLLIGVLSGLLLFSKLVSFLFERYPLPTFATFLGMVLGSLPLLCKCALRGGAKARDVLWFLPAAALVLAMEFIGGGTLDAAPYTFWRALVLFFAMTVAAASMVMPGLSGSFIMLLFGEYQTAIDALANLEFLKLLPMALGALCGIILVAKLMAWLLEQHRASTYAAILGFVFGSIVVMCMRVASYLPAGAPQILLAVVGLIAGAALSFFSQPRQEAGAA